MEKLDLVFFFVLSKRLSDLEIIDQAIEKMCKTFEELYGKANLTPNMHLAGH